MTMYRSTTRANKKEGHPAQCQVPHSIAHFPRETKEAPFGTSSADRGIHTLFATAMVRLSPEASAVSARLIVPYRPQVVHADPAAPLFMDRGYIVVGMLWAKEHSYGHA